MWSAASVGDGSSPRVRGTHFLQLTDKQGPSERGRLYQQIADDLLKSKVGVWSRRAAYYTSSQAGRKATSFMPSKSVGMRRFTPQVSKS